MTMTDPTLTRLRELYATARVDTEAENQPAQKTVAAARCFYSLHREARALGVRIRPTDCVFFRAHAEDRGAAGRYETYAMRWQPTERRVELSGGIAHGSTTVVGNAYQDEVQAGVGSGYTVYRLYGWNDTTHRWVFTPEGNQP